MNASVDFSRLILYCLTVRAVPNVQFEFIFGQITYLLEYSHSNTHSNNLEYSNVKS